VDQPLDQPPRKEDQPPPEVSMRPRMMNLPMRHPLTTDGERRRVLMIRLMHLALSLGSDARLLTRAHRGAVLGFLHGLSEQDFRWFAGQLLTDSYPDRASAADALVGLDELAARCSRALREVNR
jgi:hypothetical protein